MKYVLAFALAAAACDGSAPDQHDLTPPAVIEDLAVRANLQPPEPPMVAHGGPTLKAMQLWTLVWAGDEALGAEIDAFHAAMFASPYWTQSLAEYGVGAGTARGVYVIPGARPKTITQNEESAIVEGLFAAHEIPETDETVIDFVFGADVVSFEGQSLANACNSFSGYHFETSDPPHHPFLVELPCQDPSKRLSVFDNLTWTDSHEMAESATDPHPATDPGWQLGWKLALEVGDMCMVPGQLDVAGAGPDGGTRSYTVSRFYSAVAAAHGGLDPCVPAPAGPYFNMGMQPSDVQVAAQGHTTLNLVAFSTGAPQPMSWKAFTVATLTPDHGTAMPGDIIPITVDAPMFPGLEGSSFYFVVEITDPNDDTAAIQAWVGALDIE
ncbi:MAG TPA: hypothetical protein VFF06_20235 [Polyangia bacterium]|nr:hypothetical protein [Polyangia bacterium]